MAFTLTSTDFKDGDYLGQDHVMGADFGFPCAGGNISPALAWTDPPAGTKSFAVTCFDPDAPTGSGFWHWLVVNLPADCRELSARRRVDHAEGMPPGALQTRTDTGLPGFAGACPPEGDHPHRYLFTVHALDTEAVPVTAETMPAVVGFNLHFATLAKATLMGLYKR